MSENNSDAVDGPSWSALSLIFIDALDDANSDYDKCKRARCGLRQIASMADALADEASDSYEEGWSEGYDLGVSESTKKGKKKC
tara:strand:+ start:269 stop:520 length:252 start_codon:yes stop_codon:yes gene_type:complete